MMRLKRFIVCALEWTCGVLDGIPGIDYHDGEFSFVRHSCYGCWPLHLTERAWKLDDKWATGVWGDGSETEGN